MAAKDAAVTSDQTRRTAWVAYVILLVAILAGSSAPILVRLAQDNGMPSPLIVATRLTLAACVFMPATLTRHRDELRNLRPRHVLLIGAAGLLLALHFLLFFTGLEYTTVLITSMMLMSGPLWATTLEIVVLRARLVPAVRVGLIATVSGGVLVSLGGNPDAGLGSNAILGSGLALGSAFAFASYILIGRIVRPHLTAVPYLGLLVSAAALASLVLVLVLGTPVAGHSARGYFWALMVTLFPQLIAHSSINFVLRYFSATYVSISLRTLNVLSVIYAFFLFNEVPAVLQIVGGALILTGVIIASIAQNRAARNAKHID